MAGDFWPEAISAARELGRRAVLITGAEQLGPLPEGVRAFSYLPYSRIFPAAAANVHQAGIGTLAQALRAGRPQLIVPVAFDQPDNAREEQNQGYTQDRHKIGRFPSFDRGFTCLGHAISFSDEWITAKIAFYTQSCCLFRGWICRVEAVTDTAGLSGCIQYFCTPI